jgi:hypothetical protein
MGVGQNGYGHCNSSPAYGSCSLSTSVNAQTTVAKQTIEMCQLLHQQPQHQ